MAKQEVLEWVGGRVIFSAAVEAGGATGEPSSEDDDGRDSLLTLWVELPALHVVAQRLDDPDAPEVTFGQTLMGAMGAPAWGEPRRPKRVRVATQELAEELANLTFLEVVVAPTPELDAVVRSMDAFLGKGSYFSDPELTRADIADFFEVAGAIWKKGPWDFMEYDRVLQVDVPEHEIAAGVLSVQGAGGAIPGIVLYPSFDDFEQAFIDDEFDDDEFDDDEFDDDEGAVASGQAPGEDSGADTDEDSDDQPDEAAGAGADEDFDTHSGLYLLFQNAADTPLAMRDEVRAEGWPLPDTDVYPQLVRFVDGKPSPVMHTDFRLATTVARAFDEFLGKHRDALEDYGEHEVREGYFDARGIETILTAPHPEIDLDALFEADEEEDDSPPRANTSAGVSNPYELPLAPRALAQLESALRGFSLHYLLGLLVAVGSTPKLVSPMRWMSLVASALKSPNEAEFRALTGSIMTVYNDVIQRLADWVPHGLVPVSTATVECRQWAQGYLRICDEAQVRSQEADDPIGSLARVILLAETDDVGGGAPPTGPNAELTLTDRLERSRQMLAADVFTLYGKWGMARLEEAQQLAKKSEPVRSVAKPGRNDPCSCGSGKKYKKCCG